MVIGRGSQFISAHALRSADAAQISRLLRAQLGGAETALTGEEAAPARGKIQWMWTGPAARDGGLVADLQRQIERDWEAAFRVHDEPETFLARALVTRALLPGPWRCNLRSGSFSHPLALQRERRQSIGAALLTIAAGCLLCAAGVAALAVVSHRAAQVELTFAAQVDRLAGYHVPAKGEHALKVANDAAAQRRDVLQPFLAALQPSLLQTVQAAMDVAQKRNLYFDLLSVSRDRVLVHGSARDWSGPEELLGVLRKAGYAARLERKDALPDGRIPFGVSSEGNAGGDAER